MLYTSFKFIITGLCFLNLSGLPTEVLPENLEKVHIHMNFFKIFIVF